MYMNAQLPITRRALSAAGKMLPTATPVALIPDAIYVADLERYMAGQSCFRGTFSTYSLAVADICPPVLLGRCSIVAMLWVLQGHRGTGKQSQCPKIVPNIPTYKIRRHKKTPAAQWLRGFNDGGRGRNRTGVGGFAIRSITTLLLGPKRGARNCCTQTNWSGKRDSNSRPRPWQGRALPTELFPHRVDGRHFI